MIITSHIPVQPGMTGAHYQPNNNKHIPYPRDCQQQTCNHNDMMMLVCTSQTWCARDVEMHVLITYLGIQSRTFRPDCSIILPPLAVNSAFFIFALLCDCPVALSHTTDTALYLHVASEHVHDVLFTFAQCSEYTDLAGVHSGIPA